MSEEYTVSFRKYRPKKFEEVLGQKSAVTTLQNALRFDKTAQAYLFSGPHGVGKTTLARIFAMALNCQNFNSDSVEPCTTCTSCRDIAIGQSLDVIEIDGASNRGIEEIRKINEVVGYRPSQSKYKIFIIDEVHMLTKEAFNALLKTLEEPPKLVKFFFATTEATKILQTVLSRCQRFDLKRVDDVSIRTKLQRIAKNQNRMISEEALQKIEVLAQGSMRTAESLLDQVFCYQEGDLSLDNIQQALGLIDSSIFQRLSVAVEQVNLSEAFNIIQNLLNAGKDLQVFFEELIEYFRKELTYLLQNKTSRYSQDQLLYILDTLMQASRWILKSPMKRAFIETLLLQIIRSKNHITLDSLVKRLCELEKKEETPQANTQKQEPVKTVIEATAPEKITPLEEKKLPLATAQHDTLMRFAAVELEGIVKK